MINIQYCIDVYNGRIECHYKIIHRKYAISTGIFSKQSDEF